MVRALQRSILGRNPGASRLSISRQRTPRRPRSIASVRPTGPPPTIRTSVSTGVSPQSQRVPHYPCGLPEFARPKRKSPGRCPGQVEIVSRGGVSARMPIPTRSPRAKVPIAGCAACRYRNAGMNYRRLAAQGEYDAWTHNNSSWPGARGPRPPRRPVPAGRARRHGVSCRHRVRRHVFAQRRMRQRQPPGEVRNDRGGMQRGGAGDARFASLAGDIDAQAERVAQARPPTGARCRRA